MIDKISSTTLKKLYDIQASEILGVKESDTTFPHALKSSLERLNQSQLQADNAISGFLKGDITDVHSVMIEMQKASLNLSLALQVRSKIIQAYEEIVRMQI